MSKKTIAALNEAMLERLCEPVKLMTFDPSSRAIGWGVFNNGGQLIDHGLTRPNKKSEESARVRICDMAVDVQRFIIEHQPTDIVIEAPAKLRKGARNHGHGGSYIHGAMHGWGVGMVHGVALGYQLAAFQDERDVNVEIFQSDEWTVGKDRRQYSVMSRLPGYNPDQDKGQDLSDAIYLGWHWLEIRHHRILEIQRGTT